jgi:hypothetical protein
MNGRGRPRVSIPERNRPETDKCTAEVLNKATAGAVGNTYQFDAFGMPIASTGTIANTYLYRARGSTAI